MKIAVRYASRKGSTKKVAEAIAAAMGVSAEAFNVPVTEKADILFLGSAVYAGEPDSSVPTFIQTLSPETVGQVVVFSTSAAKQTPYAQIKQLAEAEGLTVSERQFHCPGKFLFMHRRRPNAQDLEAAAQFAKSLQG